ncbi:hypothetical protein G6F62_013869 [Rhizopus arrhizus]|nr:hypothetical protein G6F62_013869 [Rhizopus arrhizus]
MGRRLGGRQHLRRTRRAARQHHVLSGGARPAEFARRGGQGGDQSLGRGKRCARRRAGVGRAVQRRRGAGEEFPRVHRHQPAEDPGDGDEGEQQAADVMPAHHAFAVGRAAAAGVGPRNAPAEDAHDGARQRHQHARHRQPHHDVVPPGVQRIAAKWVQPVDPRARIVPGAFVERGVQHHGAPAGAA